MTPETGNPATDNPSGSLEDASMALVGLLERDDLLGAEEPEQQAEEKPAEKPVKAEAEPEKTQPEEKSEGEGEEKETAEEGEATEEQGQEPQRYTVKIDGETKEVDLPELIKGYQLEQVVTRKSMALAEERKAIQQEREQLTQIIPALLKQLDQGGEVEPDWEKLRAEDEFKFVVERQAWQVRQERRNALQSALNETQARQRKDAESETQKKLVENSAKLAEVIPEWTDDARRETLKADLRKYANSLGFSDEEIAQTLDHRAVRALYEGMKGRKQSLKMLEAVPPRPVNKGPRSAAPGSAAQTPGRTADYARAKARVKETGSVEDAAALFEQAEL